MDVLEIFFLTSGVIIGAVSFGILETGSVFGFGRRFSRELNGFLSSILAGRVDLTTPFSASRRARGLRERAAGLVNNLLSTIRDIIRGVSRTGIELIGVADNMKEDSRELKRMAEESADQATRVAAAMEQMTATVAEIVRSMHYTAEAAGTMKKEAETAEKDLSESVHSIDSLSEDIGVWAGTNRALADGAERIGGIITVIRDIADQTNLLALNAAIEAARAGRQGRGFAVVAEEVRKLADKTTKATVEIAEMVDDLGVMTESAVANMDRTLRKVAETADRARRAEKSLQKIHSETDAVADMTARVATSVEEQSAVTEDVLKSMTQMRETARQTEAAADRLAASGDAISAHAVKLYGQVCSASKDATDRAMEDILTKEASELITLLEDAVDRRRLAMDALFDERYRPLDGDRYETRATGFFASRVLPLLTRWTAANPRIIYTVVMDRNGYMPTHIMPARARLKMSDPVSLNGARTDRLVGQAFRRPLEAGGEMVVDLAVPLIIRGRHWGCLRLGYLPEDVSLAQARKP